MKNYKSLFIILPALCLLLPAIPSAQMTWTCVTDSAQWSGRWAQSVLVFHDTMWIIGGDSWRITVNNVWFSTDGDSWICATASAPWSVRSGMGSFVYDDKMWITGGFYWTGSYWAGLGDVWWSSDGINWTEATDSAGWAPRGIHTAVVFHDTMWVIGGAKNTTVGPLYNDVWKSVDGVSWVCVTDSAPWSARCGHTSVIFHDSIWVIGGWECSDVWCSNDGSNWTCAQDSVPWGVRYGRASVVFQDMIWQMAGYNVGSGRFFNDVWYSADGSNWLEALDSAPWVPRHFPAAVVYNNKIWLMGGTTNYYSGLKDVWYSTGLGIEECATSYAKSLKSNPTIVHSVLNLQSPIYPLQSEIILLDITGREVTILKSGANNIRHLSPGVYFVRQKDNSQTRKVVIMR